MNPIRFTMPVPKVACVEICRASRGNSLTPQLLTSLLKAVERAREKGARVGLLRGSGEKNFCTGYDLKALKGALDPSSLRLEPAARALENSPIPWIAFVNGRVLGGGFEILLACDYRIAAPHSVFRMPAVKLGIPYSPQGIRRFSRLIGTARTLDLFLSGREIGAEEAARIGLVNRQGSYDDALAWAADVVRGGPLAVEYTKTTLRILGLGDDPANDPDLLRLRLRCQNSRDLKEGISSAREGRDPNFRGS